MTTAEAEYKYLQNLATDETHRLLVDEAGRGRPLEQCNTDAIEAKAWLSKAEAEAAPNHCGHCWPAEVTGAGSGVALPPFEAEIEREAGE